ncbi:hypothetical protein GOP47_0017137 [Adiantum capillus-veneris]|uniref:Uncharacterized protein n=1 Tax=Adiantum capillus-veneris TaxID=13818 RepID=A0A9D4UJC6_ADICA|nr:hypothetical protein GOP47_0017137 [Adiantum capillus-veneris]
MQEQRVPKPSTKHFPPVYLPGLSSMTKHKARRSRGSSWAHHKCITSLKSPTGHVHNPHNRLPAPLPCSWRPSHLTALQVLVEVALEIGELPQKPCIALSLGKTVSLSVAGLLFS